MSAQCPFCQVHQSRCQCTSEHKAYAQELGNQDVAARRKWLHGEFEAKPQDVVSGQFNVDHVNLAIVNAERAQRYLNAPILGTPTGKAREKLTEANILLEQAVLKMREAL